MVAVTHFQQKIIIDYCCCSFLRINFNVFTTYILLFFIFFVLIITEACSRQYFLSLYNGRLNAKRWIIVRSSFVASSFFYVCVFVCKHPSVCLIKEKSERKSEKRERKNERHSRAAIITVCLSFFSHILSSLFFLYIIWSSVELYNCVFHCRSTSLAHSIHLHTKSNI